MKVRGQSLHLLMDFRVFMKPLRESLPVGHRRSVVLESIGTTSRACSIFRLAT
jgi:hypothetical protein